MFNRISMIGLGYIGLPTAALFAARGIEVIGVDVSPKVVETINAGKIHIVEPELDGIVHKAVTDGNLRATLTAEPAEAFVIAVPTPFKEDYEPDLSYIQSAANMIAPVLKVGDLVVLESTSPIGATEQMAVWLAEARPDLSFPQDAGNEADVQVAHCPERVLPGHVVRELVENDRIIGGMTERASEMAIAMYKKVVQGDCIVTDAKTAEMCKLTENSSRDVQIAFANELSVICDKFGIDVWELISLANRHPRVNILQPGAGVGGHCIAVDPWFIVASAPEEAKLIRAARDGNDGKPKWVMQKVRDAVMDVLAAEPSRSMEDIKVACLGLAFKPDIDDLRESPALGVTSELSKLGCQVLAVEPHIDALPPKLGEGSIVLSDLKEALAVADVACVLVKHSAFDSLKDKLPEGLKLIDVVGLA
ncbi:UDP-N-acetyl-D-mannosamine dehydrogenase (plasmid) [Leisingera sp. NJS201]|uniref:UDP-N-acetyl-D-mannosamine dehydrogenase n=1 Tax=Leisingera sp. NJS201 TaxID=2508306 RepID=UPI001070A37C|nr:UDP-N-acetyl-D-mannosamine dehydrogenase [Leisingera sp. NJS201]QBR38556.1 UDP-N-acetyl-D-mannosamine dehydrogenase [Leisingera sp. NJS201]